MPQYTTSYSANKKRPTHRPAVPGQQLPSARRRTHHKPGAQYLRHSQGFGRNNHGFRAAGPRRRHRNPYALIGVGVALLLFVASVIWYSNRNVDITLNGSTVSVRINSTIQQLIENQELSYRAGDLLAVDDSVLTKRGGEKYSVKLGKKQIDNAKLSSTKLTGGEKLTIGNGRNRYEKHTVKATEIHPTLKISGSGPIQYVKTWGKAGRSEVWTGKTTGKVQDRGVVKKARDCVVVCASVTPKSGKYVALTFNGGSSDSTAQIAQILKEKGASATFFLAGDDAQSNPAAAKAIVNAGCEVGSYGQTGSSFSTDSGANLRAELSGSFDAVDKAAGVKTALLRSPDKTLSELQWSQSMDLFGVLVSWTLDSGDWLLPGSDTVIETVTGGVRNGGIISLTDNADTADQTLALLPTLIDQLQGDGYKLVSVSDLISTDPDLKDAINTKKARMPKGSALPLVQSEDTVDDSADAET